MSPFGKPLFFPPDDVERLATVLDETWSDLLKNQDARLRDGRLTRDQVAQRIMDSAQLGERPSQAQSRWRGIEAAISIKPQLAVRRLLRRRAGLPSGLATDHLILLAGR